MGPFSLAAGQGLRLNKTVVLRVHRCNPPWLTVTGGGQMEWLKKNKSVRIVLPDGEAVIVRLVPNGKLHLTVDGEVHIRQVGGKPNPKRRPNFSRGRRRR